MSPVQGNGILTGVGRGLINTRGFRTIGGGGGGGGWNPIDNTSFTVLAWWDASDSSTITGTDITNWADKSTTGADMTSSSGNPDLNAGAINSLDAINFDGTEDFTTSAVSQAGDATIFIVCDVAQDSTYHQFFDGGSSSDLYMRTRNTNQFQYRTASGTWTRTFVENWNAGVKMFSYGTYDVGQSALFKGYIFENGTLDAELLRGTSGWDIAAGTFGSASASSYMKGNICEIVMVGGYTGDIVDGAGTPQSDREAIEGYLAHKWGIESKLPTGHPYKSSPPS